MNVVTLEYSVRLLFLFMIGSIFGSWLNVCIYRLAVTEDFWKGLYSLVYPPSRCPGCLNPIAFYDNIPIFGWLKLKGRCRQCSIWIPPRYMLIELLTGVLFVVVYCLEIPPGFHGIAVSSVYDRFGPQGDPQSPWFSPESVQHYRYAFHMVLVLALIVATFIDFDHYIIPDTVTLPAMTVGVLGNWLLGCVHLVPIWFQETGQRTYLDTYRANLEIFFGREKIPGWVEYVLSFKGVPAWCAAWPHLHGLLVSLAGIVVGGGIVWGVRAIGFWALKREAMGFGDVVLMAMIGSFIGWQPVLLVFFLAPVCALVVVVVAWLFWRKREIPYGPYLSIATLLTLLFWRQLWPGTEERIFGMGPLLPFVALFGFGAFAMMLVLTRQIRRLLGLPDDDGEEEVWESADQLFFQAGERPTQTEGQWPQSSWRGTLSGRGLGHSHDWRTPPQAGPPPSLRFPGQGPGRLR